MTNEADRVVREIQQRIKRQAREDAIAVLISIFIVVVLPLAFIAAVVAMGG